MKHTKQRSRSSICLLLFLLFSMSASSGTSSPDPMDQEPAHMIGRAIGSVLPAAFCLFLGTYFAFRDRRPVARVLSSALVLLAVAGFGMGVLQGLSRTSSNQLMISEAETARAGLFADLTSGGTAAELSDSHDRRLRVMARNLETSGNEDAALAARAMQIVADLMREPDLTLATTLDRVNAPLFLDVVWIVEHDALKGRLELAEEYVENSAEVLAFYQQFPQTLSRALRDTGLSKPQINAFVTGVNTSRPTQLRVYEAHGRVAARYLELLTFIAEHPDTVVLLEDGGFNIAPDEALAAYLDIYDPMQAAEQQLDSALDAHMTAIDLL